MEPLQPGLLGKPLLGTPLPTLTPYPGNCSSFFSKALNTKILSAAVGLPRALALPRAVQPPGITLPTHGKSKVLFRKNKNKTETHQINKRKRECAHARERWRDQRSEVEKQKL